MRNRIVVYLFVAIAAAAISFMFFKPRQAVAPAALQAVPAPAGKPFLIEFVSQSCPRCREIEPVINRLEQRYGASITFIRADVYEAGWRDLADQFKVTALPTISMVRADRTEFKTYEGAVPETILEKALERLLAESGAAR